MKYLFAIFLAATICVGAMAQNAPTDIGRNIIYLITLKNGKAYRGRPIMEEVGNWVRIKTNTGKKIMIAYEDIERLEKQEASITDFQFSYSVAWGGGQFIDGEQTTALFAIPVTLNYDFTDCWTLGAGFELYLGGDVGFIPGIGAPLFQYDELAFFMRPGYRLNKGKALSHHFSLGLGVGFLSYDDEGSAYGNTSRMLISPKYELGIRLSNRMLLVPYAQYNLPISNQVQPFGTWSAGLGIRMFGTTVPVWY